MLLKTHQPDIIISDVMMPVMNGYQLCKEVKEHLQISHIPVILLTAKSDTESQKIGYKLGADAYLSKPFDIDLLLSVIGNLLKQKELIKQRYEKELLIPSPALTTISNADEVFMIKLNEIIKKHYSNIDLDVTMISEAMAMSRASVYNKMKQINLTFPPLLRLCVHTQPHSPISILSAEKHCPATSVRAISNYRP